MRCRGLICLPLALLGVSLAQNTNFGSGPNYLITTDSTQFLRPIATPSLSLNAPLPPLPSLPEIGPAVTNQPYTTTPELQDQANLFPIYYGYPRIVDVELTPTQTSRELPASMNETGFMDVPSQVWLRQHGYGVALAKVAANAKAHRRTPGHVYTNEDIERLHAKSRNER
jgi:hypothetical protein